jgi:hypothetical protein
MKLRSDAGLSLQSVESYATRQLGMKKSGLDQTTVVELSKGDRSQVLQKSGRGGFLDRLLAGVERLLS